MTTLPDTFCVFILTHGRPDNVITLKTLEKCGYTGRIYLICDNEDKTLDRYRQNFGADRVIVFDKKAEAEACDSGNNFGERRTILMARNACFGIAEKLGVTHFLQLDDDYTAFDFRVIHQGKGIVRPTKSIESVIVKCLRFLDESNAHSIAFAQGGDFIGAIDNGKSAYRFSRRKCMNTFFCSLARPFRFVGAMNDDVNTYTTLGSRGTLFITIPVFSITQKITQSQSSGLTDMYKRFGTYCKSFTTVMMLPSAVRVSMIQSKNPRLHHVIDWKRTVPCIVPERFRRVANKESDSRENANRMQAAIHRAS
jgi:hypothetical protein